MKNHDAKSTDAAELRCRAEERLKNSKPPKPVTRSAEDALQLLHELEVHQIELEMQNEELRRSRAEVEAGFERYIDLYDFAPVGYLSTDCEGTISQLNLAAAGLLGPSRSELVGRRFGQFVSTGSQLTFNTFLQKACTNSAKETCEVTLARNGNDPRQVRIEAIGSENGKECRIVLIDITDQKQAEQAVRVSEERFRVAQELSPDGFTILRPIYDEERHVIDFTWVYQNPAVARLAGTDPQDVLGKRLLELFPGHRGSKFFEVYKQVAETHESCVLESQYAADIPTPRWLRLAVVPMATDIAILAQDITDRMQAEEVLGQAKTRAEQANQAKDHFLATLSHELRTPLTPILAAAQLLERRVDLPVGVRDYVDTIKRNVGLEARLIDDLLDLSRISHGKISLSIHDVDVHEVIRRAAETCQVTLHEKEQRLSFRLNAKSPIVRGDWSRLQQILWNLLSNAVKFTPSKSQIEISTEDVTGGDIEIKVIDHGKGIAPEDLPKVFTAFEQGGSSVTRDFGGLGLGLAISRGLAEIHHGTLEAFSEGLGRGSTFVLTLHAEEKEKEKEKEEEKADAAAHPLSRRILIVEDNEDTGLLMKTVLDSGGHIVHHANSVASALKAAEQENFDLLICDIGLPDGSGLEVVSSLRQRNAVDKAIAMTGYGMAEDVERCRKAGFDTHLRKPVDIEDLERLIAML